MTDETQDAAVVVRVTEGPRGRGAAQRIFSVVLDRPAEDLAVVATAADPAGAAAIPAAGDVHPDDPTRIARPPMIYPIGVRAAGGALLAARSCFYNVRVHYVGREEA